jgi:multidrug efflux pump subunit AcrA (membrane-fusion protein)
MIGHALHHLGPGLKRMLLLGTLVVLWGCSQEPPAPPVPRLVKVFTVGETPIGDSATTSRVRLEKDPAALSFDAPGRVLAILVGPGQNVVAGQAIARLDPQDAALSESPARTQFLAAQAELVAAEADFGRYQELHQKGFISVAEFDRRKAQIALSRARFEATADQLGYLTLRAIEPGLIQRILVRTGDPVAARQLVATVKIAKKAAGPEINSKRSSGKNQISILIPRSALLGENAVLRLNVQPDNTALLERVPVELGRIDESAAEVTAGLTAGDRIVAVGVQVVAEGDRVRF